MIAASVTRRADRGFTLIELMIVLTIIAILSVVLAPSLLNVMGMGQAAVTESRIHLLRQMAEKYNSEMGEYPPSDFANALPGVKVRGDATNMGIECLLIHVSQRSLGSTLSLADKRDWLANTDSDDNGADIPELGTTEKLEVVDGWLNPIAYMRPEHDGSYASSQSIMLHGLDGEPGGEVVTAVPMKDARGVLNRTKYQLISAGPDEVFNTDDDITYPKRPSGEE